MATAEIVMGELSGGGKHYYNVFASPLANKVVTLGFEPSIVVIHRTYYYSGADHRVDVYYNKHESSTLAEFYYDDVKQADTSVSTFFSYSNGDITIATSNDDRDLALYASS